jgi:hypothetical protein
MPSAQLCLFVAASCICVLCHRLAWRVQCIPCVAARSVSQLRFVMPVCVAMRNNVTLWTQWMWIQVVFMTLLFACAGVVPWAQLALFLIHAELTGDAQWGGYLRMAERATSKPATLWKEQELEELRGTQVFNTVLQYRCVRFAPSTAYAPKFVKWMTQVCCARDLDKTQSEINSVGHPFAVVRAGSSSQHNLRRWQMCFKHWALTCSQRVRRSAFRSLLRPSGRICCQLFPWINHA